MEYNDGGRAKIHRHKKQKARKKSRNRKENNTQTDIQITILLDLHHLLTYVSFLWHQLWKLCLKHKCECRNKKKKTEQKVKNNGKVGKFIVAEE